MDIKVVQAIMARLVVLAALISGVILITSGWDHAVGIGLLVIVAGYLGIDLTRWIPPGKNRRRKQNMRAIIRVTLRDVSDDQAIAAKKAVEAAVKAIPEAEVELTLMAR